MDSVIARLESTAQSDPIAAPLALLIAEALKAEANPSWDRALPVLGSEGLVDGRPILAGATLVVAEEFARELLRRLSSLVSSQGVGRVFVADDLPDAPDLIEASINQDRGRLNAMASGEEKGSALISVLGQMLALPLLQACGRRAESLLADAHWSRGYCPVCGAWPALGEVRGVERQRWLRCGRCGTGWRFRHRVCVYCGNDDHMSQGYLSTDEGREARQADTCGRCGWYLKNVASPLPLDAAEVILKDLSTLELDAAAMERGYGRPERPGFDLAVKVFRA